MITTICVNPAVDKSIRVEAFEIGKTNRVLGVKESSGGKGIMVARHLRSLNNEVKVIGFLSGSSGDKIKADISRIGISHDFIETEIETRTNIKIFDIKTGVTTELNEKGEPVSESHIEALKQKIVTHAANSSFTVITGSLLPNMKDDLYKEIAMSIKSNTNVVIDCEGEPLKLALDASPFLIKPNIDEFKTTFGCSALDEVICCAKKLVEEKKIQFILISLGKDGSILVSNENVLRVNPVTLKAKNTVGAGDSLLSGFVSEFVKTSDALKSLRMGAACATAAVMTEFGENISMDVINEVKQKIVVDSIDFHTKPV